MEMNVLVKRMALGVSLIVFTLAGMVYKNNAGKKTRPIGYCWKVDREQ